MRKALIIPLLLIVLAGTAVAGLSVAESRARVRLDRELRAFISTSYPETQIDETNVRGRPYMLSLRDQMVSTAYVEASGPADGVRRRLVVQNLDLRTGTAQSVRTVLNAPYPETLSKPTLDTTADRSQAVLDGELLTYRAEVVDGWLVITTAEHGTDSRFAPAPIDVRSLISGSGTDESTAVEITPTDTGLAVGFVATDVRGATAHAPEGSS